MGIQVAEFERAVANKSLNHIIQTSPYSNIEGAAGRLLIYIDVALCDDMHSFTSGPPEIGRCQVPQRQTGAPSIAGK